MERGVKEVREAEEMWGVGGKELPAEDKDPGRFAINNYIKNDENDVK